MELDGQTKIDSLLTAHPHLADELPAIYPQFERLRNPFLRKTLGKVATLTMAAELVHVPLEELVGRIAGLIALHEAQTPESRREKLKAILRELHAGAAPEDVKNKFQALFSGVDASEIAAVEQALLDEGMPAEEIQRLCDVHVAVFKDALEAKDAPEVAEGHPIGAYMKENRACEEILARLNTLLGRLHSPGPEGPVATAAALEKALEELSLIRIHFERKENQLFPALEAHHFTGPSQVMWSIHDQVRSGLKAAREALTAGDLPLASDKARSASKMIRDMIYKEEHILFPAALEMLSAGEWSAMAAGEASIGYAWISGPSPAAPATPEKTPGESTVPAGAKVALDTGALTREQLNLMLKHLPVDVTFVDENDRVAYYSEGPERIFPRSPAIIGREVRNCHPPKSVHVVNMILDAFKAGEKNDAAFWIPMGDKFIHIRYFAVRDGAGVYRGCLEVSQELSGLRALSGERRLLEWE